MDVIINIKSILYNVRMLQDELTFEEIERILVRNTSNDIKPIIEIVDQCDKSRAIIETKIQSRSLQYVMNPVESLPLDRIYVIFLNQIDDMERYIRIATSHGMSRTDPSNLRKVIISNTKKVCIFDMKDIIDNPMTIDSFLDTLNNADRRIECKLCFENDKTVNSWLQCNQCAVFMCDKCVTQLKRCVYCNNKINR